MQQSLKHGKTDQKCYEFIIVESWLTSVWQNGADFAKPS
jgi:hypothetical protein